MPIQKVCLDDSLEGWQVGNVPYIGGQSGSLALTHSKGQRQGHSHFDNEYDGNSDIHGKNYYCHQIASQVHV